MGFHSKASILVHDTEDTEISADDQSDPCDWYCENDLNIGAGGDSTFFSKSLTCDKATILYGFGAGSGSGSLINSLKVRLLIDGTQVAESGYLLLDNQSHSWCLIGHRSVSGGDRIVRIDVHNYNASVRGALMSGGVGGGCSKI